MATTLSIPHDQDQLAARLTKEIEDLALEIFITCYGADWDAAITTALADLPDLIAYADEYDEQAAACRLAVQAERAIADLLADLDRTEDLVNRLDPGCTFDAGCELRGARLALLRALTHIAAPAPACVIVARPFCFFCPGADHLTERCPKPDADEPRAGVL